MRIALCLCAVAVTGCMTIEDHRAAAAGSSNFQVCRAYFVAPAAIAGVAREEAARRGLDCAPFAQAVMQSERANDAATNALARQLLAPRPSPIPQQTSCTSYRVGNTIQTDCR